MKIKTPEEDFRDRLEIVLKKRSWIRIPFYLITNFLSPNGRTYLICMLFSAPLSFVALNTTVYMFLTMIVSTVTISYFFNFFYRPKVDVIRNLPSIIEAETAVIYQAKIINHRKRNFYSLRVKELFWSTKTDYPEREILEIIKPNEEKIIKITLSIEKRGLYYSDGVVVSSSFPFSLFNWGKFIKIPAKLTVFPKYTRLETFDLSLGRKFQPGGIALSSNIGESTEFIGTREFVFGDNPRHIHWRSWAKLDKPVVKEFQEEYFTRLALVIDNQTSNVDNFEKGLSMSASIADYLSRYDYIIDIFAAGNNFYHFQSGRALSHFENILELLAGIEIDTKKKNNNIGQIYADLEKHLSNLSGIIFIFMNWDQKKEQLIKGILESGTGVKVFIFSKKTDIKISPELKDFVEIAL